MIPHAGTETRVFREVEALGNELKAMPAVLDSRNAAKVAIVFDWHSWWALEQGQSGQEFTNGNTKQSYLGEMMTYYRAFFDRNILVDFVAPDGDLSNYQIVVAPNLYITSESTQKNLDAFVRAGGQLLVGFQSGILDENGHVYLGGYLGGSTNNSAKAGTLQETLGLWIEEFTPIAKGAFDASPLPKISIEGEFNGKAKVWAEVLHPTTASVEAKFVDGPSAGHPAVTSNVHGKGKAWYVATRPSKAVAGQLVEALAKAAGVSGLLDEPITNVEVVARGEKVFVMNHNSYEIKLPAGFAAKHGLSETIEAYTAAVGNSLA